MEHVAGRAEKLAKDKIKDPLPPFRARVTESLYTCIYASDGKEAHAKRAKQREVRQTVISKLGEKEYKKLLQEVDLMTHTAVDIDKLVDKRMKEIEERIVAEEQEKEVQEKQQTRSQYGKAGTSGTLETGLEPKTSPRKWVRNEEHQETDGKRPKTAGKKPKDDGHKETDGKRPKTAGKKPKDDGRKETGAKGPKKKEENEEPGIKSPKAKARGLQKERNDNKTGNDDIDESRSRPKIPTQTKRTSAIPLLRDNDDNDDNDLEVLDDEDADRNYKPNDDEEDNDDLIYPMLDDDDDDFQIPPPRVRKTKPALPVKLAKPTKKQATARRVEKSKMEVTEDISDETLSLFQKIVGDDFEVKASEEFEQESTGKKKDRCINRVEAAGFRATMKTLALELKRAVKKGERIEETYVDMAESTIMIARAMKYPGASAVEAADVLESISDLKCNAWRKHMQGITTMEPEDVIMEGDGPENEEDWVIQGPILTEEAMQAAADAIKKLPKMLIADTKIQFRNLFDNIEKAHRHAAEATKTLRELHDKLPLDVFL